MCSSFPLEHEFTEDYGLDEEGDELDIEGKPLLFKAELATQADGNKKRKSKQTKAYTRYEEKLLCECWRDVGQDPEIGVEQRHSTFWLRVHREFHEWKKFKPYKFESKLGWVSLGKH
ncbi:Lectin-domain containing receptor kinase A4.3 [Hordeum vulgare]|nr:Lectin-domain containing receptor kinase A4.3 [Hordeum vulgare]